MDEELVNLAIAVGNKLLAAGLSVTTAESCISGWVGSALAAASDSSRFYSSGFITYYQSGETTRAGRQRGDAGARHRRTGNGLRAKKLSGDKLAIAISGYAVPDNGEDGTPAGTVWFAWCLADGSVHTSRQWFSGEGEEVVRKATHFSLAELNRLLDNI